MVSYVLLLSYLDKIGLSLKDEAGQASAYAWNLQQLNLYVSTGASDDLPVLNKDSCLEEATMQNFLPVLIADWSLKGESAMDCLRN